MKLPYPDIRIRTLPVAQYLLAVLILSGAFTAGCDSGDPVNAVFTGTVTKVHDGDSIHVTPPGKKHVIIRLAAIDAPEIKQKHGIQSRDSLRALIMGKQVTAECNKLDKYNRQVCVVLIDGTDANLQMLKTGQAWYYERFKDEQSTSDQRAYRNASSRATKQKLGLWQDGATIAPWDFRALK